MTGGGPQWTVTTGCVPTTTTYTFPTTTTVPVVTWPEPSSEPFTPWPQPNAWPSGTAQPIRSSVLTDFEIDRIARRVAALLKMPAAEASRGVAELDMNIGKWSTP